MKKLLAFVSSIAVCASALAVSVLSYFPSPVQVGATAPDTSSLLTTSLGSFGTFPVISFTQEDFLNATDDIVVRVSFCPTGWKSEDDYYVFPSSYGTYSPDSGLMDFYFHWYRSDSHFMIYCNSIFGPGLSGKKLFSHLFLTNYSGLGGISPQWIVFTETAPNDSPFIVFSRDFLGPSFSPTNLTQGIDFSLIGVVGNDYDLWLASQAYPNAYADGWNQGQTDGYQDGYEHGTTDAGNNFGMWDLFSNAFGSVGDILSIQIFPGFSLGLLISVPIAFAFLLWLIHVLKG